MPTTYTSLLGLALPATGELSGTWGSTVNTEITSLLDTAVAGTTTLSTDADVTLSTTTGAANQARQAIILWTANGTVTRNITAPAASKTYVVINASAGTQSIVFRGVGPTAGVTVVKGESAVVAWNGSDFIKVSNTSGAGAFTNLSVSGTTTLSGLTASTALALDASKNVVSVTNTGTGNNVLATSPVLTTPNLGTPSAATLTNATGLPVSTGISGLGTGVATALAVNTGAAGAFVVNGGALGTPSSGTVTNLTGTASININGTVGATTPNTGAFTTLSASGVATFSAGTAAAPALTTTGDTDTGVFFPAANTWAVATGASERMRIDSSGNVGIGDTSPSSRGRLSVISTTGVGRQFVVKTDGSAEVRFNDNGNPRAFSLQNYGMTGANQGASILWSLGDTTANANDAGAIDVISEGTWGATAASRDSAMRFQTTIDGNINERMRIDSSGNVGIGTTSPAVRLDVAEADITQIRAVATTNGVDTRLNSLGQSANAGVVGTYSNHPFLLYTNSSERMRITSAGDVGIGTSSPAAKLDIVTGTNRGYFDDSAGSLFRLNAVNAANSAYAPLSLNGSVLTFQIAASERMRITSAGDVGIGTTSPSVKLHVLGSATLSGQANVAARIGAGVDSDLLLGSINGNTPFVASQGAFPLAFFVNAQERMRITSGGNVGINDSNPGYLLTLTGASNPQVWVSATNVAGNSAGISFENQGQRNWQIWADRSTDTLSFGNNSRGTTNLVIGNTGNVGIGTTNPAVRLEVAGQIRTEAPTGGTAANWRLGTVHTVTPTSPNRTIEVDIGGTIYYLHAKTTNN